jgi:hypothetical protein
MTSSPYQDVFAYLAPRAYTSSSPHGGWRVVGPGGQVVLSGPSQQTTDLPISPPRKEKTDYSKVKSKINPEETAKYLQRKRDREILRVHRLKEKEDLEMLECTFRPRISSKRMRV